jgi:hypothetical protein
MRGSSGAMRVEYVDPGIGPVVVDQTMRLEPRPGVGFVLFGANPIHPYTRMPISFYHPDNFLFLPQPNGSIVVICCDIEIIRTPDPTNLCAPVTARWE